MLSVLVLLEALATVTYSGSVPVGIVFDQLLASVAVVICLVIKL